MKKFILLVCLFNIASTQVASDYVFNGAGNSAMAGAVTSCPEPSRMYSQNPASLANLKGGYIFLHRSSIYGLSTLPFQIVSLGFKSKYFGFTGLTIEQSSVEYRNTQLSSEQSIGINKGFNLHHDRHSALSLGINLNLMEIKFTDSAGQNGNGSNGIQGSTIEAIGIDVGLLASLRNKYYLGAFIKNVNHPAIGTGISRQDLPRRISLGASYRPANELITSFEIERELGKEMQVQAGFIFTILPPVDILMGIQSNPGRMGAGINFDLNGFEFTWSILTHPILPATQFYSIGYTI